jgi:bifunctional non-homologous end joining protein LigD
VSLKEYRRKRDPKKTPEPFPVGKRRGKAPIFVVQRHAARRLHYDFRLERNGALASWAVPKGIPLERGQRNLAVHVEDHPLEYATFEGEIPKGEYGAGTVEIWDSGTYELLEEKPNGGLTVRLHGKRLDGVWSLIPAHLDGDPKNWLILRKNGAAEAAVARPRYAPMLASSSDTVPEGEGWLFEPKWDGFRAIAVVAGGDVTLTSRNGNDLTERFRPAARALAQAVRTPSAVLDGEIVALEEPGRSSFSALQQGTGTLAYVSFDVVEADGEPLLDRPLVERRKVLERLIDPKAGGVVVSPVFEEGDSLLRAASAQGLEGIVAKRADSRYQPGRRSPDWRKIKVKNRQEFVIAGYTKGQGRRAAGFGSLVLGVYDEGELRWVGNVGTGFTEAEIQRLLERLRPLERDAPPFPEAPKMPRVRRGDVVWVEAKLLAEVAFAEWTHDGRLRAPVYLGLRDDKPATEVRRERTPIPAEIRERKRVLKLSNLDKLFWPEEGITKGDVLAYYRDVADVLVPHLRDRPFTMKRYPDGWKGNFFFQKNAPSHMPEWIPRVALPASTREGEQKTINYPLVNDRLALLWMVNMGCIDMNAWYSRVDKPDRPDFVLFDLDPSPDVGFPETIEVALLVREALELLELECHAKTSGSRGIHILVPVARRHTYDDTRRFAEVVAGAIARAHTGLATTEWSKQKRRGVLIDANQNGAGKTIASAYSVRPRDGAPGSTPLRWDEVRPGLDPAAFTMDAVLDRVARHGDLFEPVLHGRQSLTKALKALA